LGRTPLALAQVTKTTTMKMKMMMKKKMMKKKEGMMTGSLC
jgi:hypothetical protein